MSARELNLFEWGVVIGSAPFMILVGIVYGLVMTGSVLGLAGNRVEAIWVKLMAKRQTVDSTEAE